MLIMMKEGEAQGKEYYLMNTIKHELPSMKEMREMTNRMRTMHQVSDGEMTDSENWIA